MPFAVAIIFYDEKKITKSLQKSLGRIANTQCRCVPLLHKSHAVWSVCVCWAHKPCCAKTAELVEMPLGKRTRVY